MESKPLYIWYFESILRRIMATAYVLGIKVGVASQHMSSSPCPFLSRNHWGASRLFLKLANSYSAKCLAFFGICINYSLGFAVNFEKHINFQPISNKIGNCFFQTRVVSHLHFSGLLFSQPDCLIIKHRTAPTPIIPN